jgi:hypothetical protein
MNKETCTFKVYPKIPHNQEKPTKRKEIKKI